MVKLGETLDRLMKAEVDEGRVVGNSALLIKDGQELYYNEFGYADRENGVPMRRDTIIRLYSMTKPVTAVAVMIAQERGYIDLLDPVSKYLPEYGELKVLKQSKAEDGSVSYSEEPLTRPLRLMNLLTMTSGIPYGENWEGCSSYLMK